MNDSRSLERMRADWNARAGEDANYYVAFGRRSQEEEEFFSTGADVVRLLERELKRLAARDRALEIGCGPGRLMLPLSRRFRRIDGVDISDEMIRLARERLRRAPNAHPHHNSGQDLAMFADESFDFVYSYAVFQHIPSAEVIWNYLREACRVLKPGGVLRCQVNGLPPADGAYDTWSGARISPDEVKAFAHQNNLQLLALEDVWTQYMWATCRKPCGVDLQVCSRPPGRPTRIRHITNALTGDRAAPASGPLAALALWIEWLPDIDLNEIGVTADGLECRPIYIGPPEQDGVSQVNAWLPPGIRTGLVHIEATCVGEPLCPPAWMRIIPAAPGAPRIGAVTDAVNLLSGNRVVSGLLKVVISDLPDAALFSATVDGLPAREMVSFCTDQTMRRYEFNFRLPEGLAPGPHQVRVAVGRRELAPVKIEVA